MVGGPLSLLCDACASHFDSLIILSLLHLFSSYRDNLSNLHLYVAEYGLMMRSDVFPILFQGHCLAYEHGSSACDDLAVSVEKGWQHSGDNSARRHATSSDVTGAASRNLSLNLALVLLTAAVVGLWPPTTTRAA